jgi:hypothetical protein
MRRLLHCLIVAALLAAPPVLARAPEDLLADAAAERAASAVAVERLQDGMLARQLRGLASSRPDVSDIYFLGVAGYGHQDVFMHEVRYAQRLFDERFDTAQRSLTLINNATTLREAPLASPANLRQALAGIAQHMDTERDLLFLFMTSHGNPNAFSTFFGGIVEPTISPAELAAALDDAGIRWRVIVISACYSGSFVDALRDDRTLVITAARADRTSFGCSNTATFTYFGEAFLAEGLRERLSFVQAFDLARRRVTAREKAENLTPSEPQRAVGRKMAGKLREIETRLKAAQAAATH